MVCFYWKAPILSFIFLFLSMTSYWLIEPPGFCCAKFCAKFNDLCKICKISVTMSAKFAKKCAACKKMQKMQNLQSYTKNLQNYVKFNWLIEW